MILRALLLVVPVATVASLVHAVRADGLGHRPPPRSHVDDDLEDAR